jgi:hypothetical protein
MAAEAVTAIIRVCEIAVRAAPSALAKIRERQFSSEEQDLLAGASRDGTFHVHDIDQSPYPLVKAGGACYSSPDDPAACARYLAAFKKLCERGYVQHQSGVLFTLTADGFTRAEAIVGPAR